jgi:hypothetical protein
MIRIASQLGMLTTPYVFCSNDAIEMTKAGADIIVCHLGLTSGGTIGIFRFNFILIYFTFLRMPSHVSLVRSNFYYITIIF